MGAGEGGRRGEAAGDFVAGGLVEGEVVFGDKGADNGYGGGFGAGEVDGTLPEDVAVGIAGDGEAVFEGDGEGNEPSGEGADDGGGVPGGGEEVECRRKGADVLNKRDVVGGDAAELVAEDFGLLGEVEVAEEDGVVGRSVGQGRSEK